ncbi:limbic system-associated membrane protein isoform 4 precursor [Mus musculus]|uniref:Limbic system-associated membrane protein isoform X1 n=1 Tax=Mus caroli TaxID=10089 RepID=A0A6P5RCA1_MUSCR|nr:limbic system-associated membrane protein isoform 4 precursor [Mus musculus]XP_021040467.2 limbic system-associated membrane protein isoform X1 [Mus caroli]XP_029400263.1 limbic system-associated membrane protein isoform X1 [Mus pahari]
MRTYWLHSVWVLGFFLSLFSLQVLAFWNQPPAEVNLSPITIPGLPVRSVDFNRGTDNITVRQGDTAILRCVVEDKNSKVAWLNRSGIIFAGHDKWSLDPRVELEKRHALEYSLRIQKVDVYDEGSYTCSVQTQHEPKTSQVYLIVQVPPKISNISSDVTVNEGSNVTLVCMANGRPEPVITWRHLTPLGREFEGEEEYLEILGITREQSGKYECKAANEVSSADVKQVKVTVNYPPTITESKSNEATTGRQASLKCEASAVPAPDFEWYRDDTRINSANGLEIKSTEGQSSLTVTNVTEEHYGNYTCVAANKLGVTNASLVLFKRVLPTVPHPIQEIGTTVHFKPKGPGSVRGINGSVSLAVPLWLLAASLFCLLSKC